MSGTHASNDRKGSEVRPALSAADADTPLPYADRQPPVRPALLIVTSVTVGLILILAIWAWQRQPSPSTHAGPPASSAPSADDLIQLRIRLERLERWTSRIQPRLRVCDKECKAGIDNAIQVFEQFMSERKRGTRSFAQAMLTHRGKWAFLRGKLPHWLGGRDGTYRTYLQEQFTKNIFSSEDLKTAIENAVRMYFFTVQAAENHLLVDVRADLADIPLPALPSISSDEKFQAAFDQLRQDVVPSIATDIGVDVARELTTLVISDAAESVAARVMTAVAMRLGLSAGILGTGASTSWATSGLSVVAAIVVDEAVGWIINKVRDPVGKLEVRINEILDDVTGQIIEGTPDEPGLKSILLEIDCELSERRAEALRQLILGD